MAGSCIDLISTNSKYSFQYSLSIETGLTDKRYLIFSMMKIKVTLQEPKKLVYNQKKTKIFKVNYKTHASNILRLAIMKHSHLKNKIQLPINKQNY